MGRKGTEMKISHWVVVPLALLCMAHARAPLYIPAEDAVYDAPPPVYDAEELTSLFESGESGEQESTVRQQSMHDAPPLEEEYDLPSDHKNAWRKMISPEGH